MDLATRAALLREADLYVVITESFCAGRASLEVLDACLDAGVRMVQLREKELPDRDLLALARSWREATLRTGALFILDDRVDIALAADADGVHLGRSDLPLEAAQRIAPELLLGASTHTLEQALDAQERQADYINIGPIFPTKTKTATAAPVGPELIAEIRPRLRIPFTCMGGIKTDNVDRVLEQGAHIVAVVTAVTAAPDIRAATTELRHRILARRRGYISSRPTTQEK